MSKAVRLFELVFLLLLGFVWPPAVDAQIAVCQANCDDSRRIYGPIRMEHTRPYPWKQAQFPTSRTGFCKMGCQLFFAEFPRNITCKRMCDYYYRTRITVGYSDLVAQALNDCRDGCDIALQVCQPGFYCTHGQMLPCLPGTYRQQVASLSVTDLEATSQCNLCPPGRYRPDSRGKSTDDCRRCPIGKYANIPGSKQVSDCKRCPAGKNAEEEGMALCKCVTVHGTVNSCDTKSSITDEDKTDYFMPDASGQSVDYFRETIPYIGRW